jgi:hypothetical protein
MEGGIMKIKNMSGPPGILPHPKQTKSTRPWDSDFVSRKISTFRGFSANIRVILRAMKRYGIILADNGSAWYVSGAPDERWDNDELRDLKSALGANFEAVDVSSLMLDSDSGQCMPQNQSPDYNGDGDIDGSDLGEYAKRIQLGIAALTMELFALNFRRSVNSMP